MNRFFRIVVILLLSLQALACQAQKSPTTTAIFSSKDTVISHESLSEIKSMYEQKIISAHSNGDNDPYWTPEVVLPQISSWFRLGRGLVQLESVSEDFLVYHLAPLPDELMNKLEKVLLKERFSLAILTMQFWMEVQQAQKQGLKIAFISSKSPSAASGVYFHELNLIGLDILSEPGTLPHELRHHEQYRKVSLGYIPKALNFTCLRQMSHAFGEIDATTFELGLYDGIEKEFNALLNDPKPGSFHLMFPQADFLNISLNYPLTMSQMIKNSSDCPSEVTEPMGDLTEYFIQQMDNLKALMEEIRGPIIQLRSVQQKLSGTQCEAQSNPACEKLSVAFVNQQEKLSTAQENFRIRLLQDSSDRPKKLKEILSRFPRSIQKDLCKGAIGVHSYLNCEIKKEKKTL